MRLLFLMKEWIRYPKLRDKKSVLSRLDSLSEHEVSELQKKKLKKLLQTAVRDVPFYRQLALAGEIDANRPRLEQFPILEKKDIRGREKSFVSDRYDLRKLSHPRTSGSTGEPFCFYKDPAEFDYTYIDLWRGLARAGIRHGDKRVLVKGVDEVPHVSLMTRLLRFCYGVINQCIVIDAHFLALSEENILHSLRKIRRYHPIYLHGYVSSIDLLASTAEKLGMRMDDIGIKVAVTESEKLYDFQRERIARVFGCKVVENYGSVEFGMIAQPDAEGNLCINESHCYVETTAEGEAVLTNLDAYAFPFIRFKNGDRLTIRQTNKSSLPYREIEQVEGRIADTIHLPDGSSLQGFIVMYPLSKHLKYIASYQVRQESVGRLDILLVPALPIPDEIKDQITRETREIVGMEVDIALHIVDQIPLTKRGKRRFVVSLLGNEA